MSYKCTQCNGTGEIPNTEYLLKPADMCWPCMGSGRVEERRSDPRYERRQAKPIKPLYRLTLTDISISMEETDREIECFIAKDGLIRAQQREGLPQRQEDMS